MDFPDAKFYRVIPNGWYKPKDLEWKDNVEHMVKEKFMSKFALELKNQ